MHSRIIELDYGDKKNKKVLKADDLYINDNTPFWCDYIRDLSDPDDNYSLDLMEAIEFFKNLGFKTNLEKRTITFDFENTDNILLKYYDTSKKIFHKFTKDDFYNAYSDDLYDLKIALYGDDYDYRFADVYGETENELQFFRHIYREFIDNDKKPITMRILNILDFHI